MVKVKENNTVVEAQKIAVDGSSLYYFGGKYYMRVYVKYRINSSKTIYENKMLYDTNNIFYTSYPICFNNYKLGEWKECCFDVSLTKYADDDNLGVFEAILVEPYYTERKIK